MATVEFRGKYGDQNILLSVASCTYTHRDEYVCELVCFVTANYLNAGQINSLDMSVFLEVLGSCLIAIYPEVFCRFFPSLHVVPLDRP